MDKPKKKMGRPATGFNRGASVRLSDQQRALALQAARLAGKKPTVAGGIHALIAQFAATQRG